jgi:hypothetical protein
MSNVRLVVNEFDLEKLSDDWESLVNAGIGVAEAHDRNRYTLGDLANRVARKYGESTLSEYAHEINVRPSTMYDYAAVSSFYTMEDRAAYPPLNWSHYRVAIKAGSHEHAVIWLAKAADEGWSVDELDEQLRVGKGESPRPRKLVEVGAQFNDVRPKVDDNGVVLSYDAVFRVSVEAYKEINEALRLRGAYTLKVYGVPEASDG